MLHMNREEERAPLGRGMHTQHAHTDTYRITRLCGRREKNSRVGEVADRMPALLTEARRLDLKDDSV